MKRISGLILCCLFAFGLKAQVSGYLGKRLYVDLEYSFVPALLGPTYNNRGANHYGEDGGGLGFSTKPSARLNYVISRKGVLNVGYSNWRTATQMRLFSRRSINSSSEDSHDMFTQIKVNTITIGYRVFNTSEGAIAPLGSYFSLYLHRHSAEGSFADRRSFYSSSSIEYVPNLEVDTDYTMYAFGFDFGKHFIFADRYILGAGINFSIPLDRNVWNDIFDETTNEDGNQGIYDVQVAKRMSEFTLVMFNISAGFLIY